MVLCTYHPSYAGGFPSEPSLDKGSGDTLSQEQNTNKRAGGMGQVIEWHVQGLGFNLQHSKKKKGKKPGMMAHAYNRRYFGGGDQENCFLRSAQTVSVTIHTQQTRHGGIYLWPRIQGAEVGRLWPKTDSGEKCKALSKKELKQKTAGKGGVGCLTQVIEYLPSKQHKILSSSPSTTKNYF
jgi:hypothetical protein